MLKESLLKQQNQLLQKAIISRKSDGLCVRMFKTKGRGVVAKRAFKKGDFVIEYRGKLIPIPAAKRREEKYDSEGHDKGYMYYFQHQDRGWCVDATAESRHMGRLINHSLDSNLNPQIVEVHGLPHIALIANQDISPGSEFVYDYSERRPAILKANRWLSRSRTQAPHLADVVDKENSEDVLVKEKCEDVVVTEQSEGGKQPRKRKTPKKQTDQEKHAKVSVRNRVELLVLLVCAALYLGISVCWFNFYSSTLLQSDMFKF
jgi:histone-lysine N-methyltransferase SETD8